MYIYLDNILHAVSVQFQWLFPFALQAINKRLPLTCGANTHLKLRETVKLFEQLTTFIASNKFL